MKYIITKDGRILNKDKIICFAFDEEYYSPNWNDDIEAYLQTKIVAEANTIEELCDGFYLDNDENVSIDNFYSYWAMGDNFSCDNDSDYNIDRESFKTGNIKFYGFIKTNKGLIYVAKMNEKGELELL